MRSIDWVTSSTLSGARCNAGYTNQVILLIVTWDLANVRTQPRQWPFSRAAHFSQGSS
jgi:hypothetical protein